MDSFKELSCSLCLNVISGQQFEVIETFTKFVLDVLLNRNYENDKKHVICTVCSAKLHAAFKFKSICLDTENVILPYINDEVKLPPALEEIYVKLKGVEEGITSLTNEQKVCRLCMQLITGEFKSMREIEVDLIHKYIPELRSGATRDPVLCEFCWDSFHTHTNFLSNCRQAEQQLQHRPELNVSFDPCIKSDKVEVKSDESEHVFIKNETVEVILEEDGIDGDTPPGELSVKEQGGKAPFAETQFYNCHVCDYRSKSKYQFGRHMSKHASEMTVYKCQMCDYQGRDKYKLKKHMLIHADPSEIVMYPCELCEFRTKRKYHLRQHMLTHADPSEVPMHRCQVCGFQTKWKYELKRHMPRHADVSEIDMHQCQVCDYQTRRKSDLKTHMVIHADPSEVKMHRCQLCSFETKWKSDVTRHMLKHADPSEIKMHACEICDFTTKRRCELTQHMLKHSDPSKVEMFRCPMCRYESMVKANLRRHMLRHANAFKRKTQSNKEAPAPVSTENV